MNSAIALPEPPERVAAASGRVGRLTAACVVTGLADAFAAGFDAEARARVFGGADRTAAWGRGGAACATAGRVAGWWSMRVGTTVGAVTDRKSVV